MPGRFCEGFIPAAQKKQSCILSEDSKGVVGRPQNKHRHPEQRPERLSAEAERRRKPSFGRVEGRSRRIEGCSEPANEGGTPRTLRPPHGTILRSSAQGASALF